MRPSTVLVVFHVDGKYCGSLKPDRDGHATYVFTAAASIVRVEVWIDGAFRGGDFYNHAYAVGDSLRVPYQQLARGVA